MAPLNRNRGRGRLLALIATLCSLALVATGCSTSTSTSTRKLSVVSIGDSIASGEGIAYGYRYDANPPMHWNDGTASPTWEGPYPLCHVTPEAFGDTVAKELRASYTNFACTGSTYSNGVTGPRTVTQNGSLVTYRPAQFGNWFARTDLNAAYDAARPDLVLISLGADDVDFVQIVTACVIASVTSPTTCTASNPGSVVRSDLIDRLPTLSSDYKSLVRAIQERGRAAKPSKVPFIVFSTYPNPLPAPGADISIGVCPDAAHLNAAQISYLSSLVSRINGDIRSSVAGSSGVAVTDSYGAYAGHQLCSKDPWVYGPSVLLVNPASTAPYHPTPAGQQALAAAVLRVLPPSLRGS